MNKKVLLAITITILVAAVGIYFASGSSLQGSYIREKKAENAIKEYSQIELTGKEIEKNTSPTYKILLEWKDQNFMDSEYARRKYLIYRNGNLIASSSTGAKKEYVDNVEFNNSPYTYKIETQSSQSGASTYSNSVSVQTLFAELQDLKLSGESATGGIKLKWVDPNIGKNNTYKIFKNKKQLIILGNDIKEYLDRDVTAGQKYTYQMEVIGIKPNQQASSNNLNIEY